MAPAGIGRRVEGLHAVTAAIEAGRVQRLLVDRRRRDTVAGIVRTAESTGIPVEVVADIHDHADSASPQGLVADCSPLRTVELEDLAATTRPAILMLDHVVDPHNLGAIARSGLAAGMTGLVVSTDRAAPFSATAFKAAVGALERLPVCLVTSIGDAVRRLVDLDVWSVGLDASAEGSLFGLELLTEPVALVVGAEGGGLGRLVKERCDVLASIPMAGPTESLNASVAAALAAFEVWRVRREADGRAG